MVFTQHSRTICSSLHSQEGLVIKSDSPIITNLPTYSNTKTRMTTFIKTKYKIGLLWSRESFEESTISDFESPSNFQVKEQEKIFKSVHKQVNWTYVVQTVIWGK